MITATLLAAAVATPVAGRLGDMYGKRRLLLASTAPLVAGSAVCALSSSVAPMIVGRGLQGLGMGIVPLGISLLRDDVLPPEKLGSAIALMSASIGVGGVLGLPFSAAVAEHASWRALFRVAAGLSLLVGVLVLALVPTGRVTGAAGRFDVLGALGLGGGLVALLLAVSKGSVWGWGSATTLGLFAAAAVVLLAWGAWELRTRDPLVDLSTTARPQVLMTDAASVLVGFAMAAQSLVVPQLLQRPPPALRERLPDRAPDRLRRGSRGRPGRLAHPRTTASGRPRTGHGAARPGSRDHGLTPPGRHPEAVGRISGVVLPVDGGRPAG